MARKRDVQRQRVYDAERRAFGWGEAHPLGGKRLETMAELQAYVDRVWDSGWRKRKFPRAASRILVKDGRGRRSACAWYNAIAMPAWSRVEWVVLHELAHCASHGERHGRAFCSAYLKMVRKWLGKEAARALRRQFLRGSVRHRRAAKKRKRAPTPPPRQLAAAALERWRQEQRLIGKGSHVRWKFDGGGTGIVEVIGERGRLYVRSDADGRRLLVRRNQLRFVVPPPQLAAS